MTVLSLELCQCPTGCSGMDLISVQRPYPFQYVAKVLTNAKQYDYMAYITFPYNTIYLTASSYDIDCSSSFLYSSPTFYQWTQLNPTTCLYNGTFPNMFVSLKQLSASQDMTIYFDETRRRDLCGMCGCDVSCEQTVAIVVGVIASLIGLVCIIWCIHSNTIKDLVGHGKNIINKPFRRFQAKDKL